MMNQLILGAPRVCAVFRWRKRGALSPHQHSSPFFAWLRLSRKVKRNAAGQYVLDYPRSPGMEDLVQRGLLRRFFCALGSLRVSREAVSPLRLAAQLARQCQKNEANRCT